MSGSRLKNLRQTGHRVLVTGSRGKSSVVRLLRAALQSAGIDTWARITGVEPRELGPGGERLLERSAGAHVEEMRWWLRRVPLSAGAVVLENSAVTPEFQHLAGQWLAPGLTVLTSIVPDHQESWGFDPGSAARVLCGGIPEHGLVLLPGQLEGDADLRGLLANRRCRVVYANSLPRHHDDPGSVNRGLAAEAAKRLGLPEHAVRQALEDTPSDRYDFRVMERGGAEVALAFSANDPASTRALFESLGWAPNETRLVYNHRGDRPERYRAFLPWMRSGGWGEVLVVGDRPPGLRIPAYRSLGKDERIADLVKPGDRVFGCGNIAGLPLALY